MTDRPLTPEREQEIREKLVTEGRTFGVKGTLDLLAEIDRLRAELAEKDSEKVVLAERRYEMEQERDRLRAELERVRALGDQLAEALVRIAEQSPKTFNNIDTDSYMLAREALAAWREAR